MDGCHGAGIFLMGYGLVAIPRQLWRIADIKGAEKASFHKAGLQADRGNGCQEVRRCNAHLRRGHVPCCHLASMHGTYLQIATG